MITTIRQRSPRHSNLTNLWSFSDKSTIQEGTIRRQARAQIRIQLSILERLQALTRTNSYKREASRAIIRCWWEQCRWITHRRPTELKCITFRSNRYQQLSAEVRAPRIWCKHSLRIMVSNRQRAVQSETSETSSIATQKIKLNSVRPASWIRVKTLLEIRLNSHRTSLFPSTWRKWIRIQVIIIQEAEQMLQRQLTISTVEAAAVAVGRTLHDLQETQALQHLINHHQECSQGPNVCKWLIISPCQRLIHSSITIITKWVLTQTDLVAVSNPVIVTTTQRLPIMLRQDLWLTVRMRNHFYTTTPVATPPRKSQSQGMAQTVIQLIHMEVAYLSAVEVHKTIIITFRTRRLLVDTPSTTSPNGNRSIIISERQVNCLSSYTKFWCKPQLLSINTIKYTTIY